jgi:energy-coupling factor transport system permease protein
MHAAAFMPGPYIPVIVLSPRIKVLLYIILAVLVFFSTSLKSGLVLLAVVAVFASRVPLSTLRKGLVPVLLFLTFTFISNVMFQTGEVVYEILGISVTKEGMVRGGYLTLRLFILILGAKVLTATTKAEELISAVVWLLGPAGKLNYVRELTYTMMLTLRLLPIIYDEAMDVYQHVKNSDENGLTGKVRLSVDLLTSLFQRSLERAKEMSDTDAAAKPQEMQEGS